MKLYAPADFTPRRYPWYKFMSEAELTSGLQCVRKDYVSEEHTKGIEPATFHCVAQCLSHLRHSVPQS